jgi:hypothetical protein
VPGARCKWCTGRRYPPCGPSVHTESRGATGPPRDPHADGGMPRKRPEVVPQVNFGAFSGAVETGTTEGSCVIPGQRVA